MSSMLKLLDGATVRKLLLSEKIAKPCCPIVWQDSVMIYSNPTSNDYYDMIKEGIKMVKFILLEEPVGPDNVRVYIWNGMKANHDDIAVHFRDYGVNNMKPPQRIDGNGLLLRTRIVSVTEHKAPLPSWISEYNIKKLV